MVVRGDGGVLHLLLVFFSPYFARIVIQLCKVPLCCNSCNNLFVYCNYYFFFPYASWEILHIVKLLHTRHLA
jgi:hypothetical protein